LFVGLYTFELSQVGLFALASAYGPLLCMILAVGGTAVFHGVVYSRIRPTIEYLPSSVPISDEEIDDSSPVVLGPGSISRVIWIPNGPIAAQIENEVPVSSTGLTVDSTGTTSYDGGPPDVQPS